MDWATFFLAARWIAASGPVTTLGESLAVSVGAGAFLGGFATGAIGLVLGRSPKRREQSAVNGGYVGGAAMVVALAIEAIIG